MSEHTELFGFCKNGCKVPVAPLTRTEEIENSLYMPPLNLNADFQINQRGQSEYNYSNIYGFTIDCWQISKLTLEVLDNGCIKLTNNDSTGHTLTQKIVLNGHYKMLVEVVDFVDNNTSDYISCILIRNSQGEVLGDEINEVGEYSFEYNGEITEFAFAIPPSCSITLKYFALYPASYQGIHHKEDYVIALMRCQTKYFRTDAYERIAVAYQVESKKAKVLVNHPTSMSGLPTISYVGNNLYLTNQTGGYSKVLNIGVFFRARNRSQIELELETDFDLNKISTLYDDDGNSYLEFSCE